MANYRKTTTNLDSRKNTIVGENDVHYNNNINGNSPNGANYVANTKTKEFDAYSDPSIGEQQVSKIEQK